MQRRVPVQCAEASDKIEKKYKIENIRTNLPARPETC
jgi:hypothetical protein